LLEKALGNVDVFLAQTEEDRRRLIEIGASESKVTIAGNLKFDVAPPPSPAIVASLHEGFSHSGAGPVLVCGSTLEDEEGSLLSAFRNILANHPKAVMVLAPRHPERFAEVGEFVEKLGFRMWRRSLWNGEPLAGGVFLVDSIGELAALYSLATVAFVGGSLVPRGGHNILEPALYGVPIVTGNHYENFRDVVNFFASRNAVRIVGLAEMPLVFIELIENGGERTTLGRNALAALESQRGATARTVSALLQLMSVSPYKAQSKNGQPPGRGLRMNPLTGLYGAATALRNTLFDRGVLPSRRLERPVVSVGNLSVGGSGKTPFVIALGELLKARGIRFDVLTRGYGRMTRGVLIVETDGKAADFGDEPLLIARRLGVPVIVGESRYEAGRVAELKFQPQLHILDDGFQHRSLVRDFDIVLATERDFDDRLLPSGRLREPLSSLRRADAIVLPQEFFVHDLSAQNSAIKTFALQGKLIWQMNREIVMPAALVAPIVFCGIARPQQFFAQVRAAGITPAAEIEFRDHHAYDRGDIERLLAMRGNLGAGSFLTTEKDAVNLGSLQADLKPFAVAALSLTLHHPAEVVDAILARTIFARIISQ
jgi:tetraacyldisaccharide 4'-kinase